MAKKKETTTAITPLSVEVIVPIESTTLDFVTNIDLFKQGAAELAETYADFSLDSIKTKEDYESMKADLSTLVKLRTTLDKRRKEINRQTNAAEAELQDLINPTETKLAAVKKQYEDSEAAKAKAEAERLEKIFKSREAEIFQMGGSWGGSMYQLGMAMATKHDLQDDAKWADVQAEFKAEETRIAIAAKIERTRNERTREVMPLFLFLSPEMQTADLGTMPDDVYAAGIAAAKDAKAAKDAEDDRIRKENERLAKENAEKEAARLKAEQDEAARIAEAAANEAAANAKLLFAERKDQLIELGAQIVKIQHADGTFKNMLKLGEVSASREAVENDWVYTLEKFTAEAARLAAPPEPVTPKEMPAPPAAPATTANTPKSFEPIQPPTDETQRKAYLSGAYVALKMIADGVDYKAAWIEIKKSVQG